MIRKICLAIAALAILAFSAAAQNVTTVTATIADANGIPYSNASVSAQLVPTGVTPTVPPPCNGQSVTPCVVSGFTQGSLNASGTFSMNLADNGQITQSGTKWQFTITISPGISVPLGSGPQQIVVTTAIDCATNTPAICSSNAMTITSALAPVPALIVASFAGGTGNISGTLTAGTFPVAAGAHTIQNSILTGIQGTDVHIMSAGTISGLAALLCTDSAGGATTVGCPAAGGTPGSPTTSIQFNNAGSFGGANFDYNAAATDNSCGVAPITTCSAIFSNVDTAITLNSADGTSTVTMYAQGDNAAGDRSGFATAQVTTTAAFNIGFFSLTQTGGTTTGGGCFNFYTPVGTPTCSEGFVAQVGDNAASATNGQDAVSFVAGPTMNKSSGNMHSIAGFEFLTPTNCQIDCGATPNETAVNIWGIEIQNLGGFSTTESAAIRIETQTGAGSGATYAIHSLATQDSLFAGPITTPVLLLTDGGAVAGGVVFGVGTPLGHATANTITLEAPSTATAYEIELPGTIGTINQVLSLSSVTGGVAVAQWATVSGSGNTTSTLLTSNTVPKANGANSIINSSISDNGTTVSTTEGFSAASLTDTGITGSTQCLQANSSGLISGTGATCGGGGISGLTPGFLPVATSATTIGNSLCDQGITTANTLTCTDSAGMTLTAGTLTVPIVATSGSTAGAYECTQGTANGHATANTITLECPASVTSYEIVLPAAAASGLALFTNASNVDTISIGALSGDITSSGFVTTLATVNSNVGSFTNANITVNAKGLITAASNGSAGSTSFPITVSGTVNSGGIPCFNSTTNEQTSALLAANGIVLGGGSGACPSTVAGISTDGTSHIDLGVAGTSVGGLVLANATSGTITLQATTGALGSVVATLPANTGTLMETNLAQTISAVQTISATNGLVLSAMTGTSCLEEVSGVVTATGSACGGGGGGVTIEVNGSSTGLTSTANFNATSPSQPIGSDAHAVNFAATTSSISAYINGILPIPLTGRVGIRLTNGSSNTISSLGATGNAVPMTDSCTTQVSTGTSQSFPYCVATSAATAGVTLGDSLAFNTWACWNASSPTNCHYFAKASLATTSAIRFYAGLTSFNVASALTTDNPQNTSAFWYCNSGTTNCASTPPTSTNYACLLVNSGGTRNAVDTGIAAGSTLHIFEIQVNDSAGTATFLIDGNVVCGGPLSTDFPTGNNATAMTVAASMSAIATSLNWAWYGISSIQ